MDANSAQEIVAEFVAKLVEVRTEKGISQYRLAELTGLSREAIRLIEDGHGKRGPTLQSLLLICSALELDLGSGLMEIRAFKC